MYFNFQLQKVFVRFNFVNLVILILKWYDTISVDFVLILCLSLSNKHYCIWRFLTSFLEISSDGMVIDQKDKNFLNIFLSKYKTEVMKPLWRLRFDNSRIVGFAQFFRSDHFTL